MLRNPVSPLPSRVRGGLVLAAVFLGVMALFFTYHDPYRDVGGDILVGSDFEQNPFDVGGTKPDGPWRGSGASISWEPHGGFDSSGGIRLAPHQGHGSNLRYTVTDPRRFQFLRVAGRLRSERIVVSERGGNTARLLLFFTDRDDQPHWDYPHVVCVITATQPWQRCVRVFPVPEFAVAAHVVVQNAAASGTLWVDELRLTPAVEKPSTFVWRATFATSWCGILAYCAWTARLPRQKLGVPILAIGILIIAGVGAPEPALEKILSSSAQALNALVDGHFANLRTPPAQATVRSPGTRVQEVGTSEQQPPLPSGSVIAVKKLGHFVLFGLLALLAFLSATRRQSSESSTRLRASAFATVALALFLFAAAAEIMQFLTTTRTPSLFDWAIDAGGILLGATIALVTPVKG
jgi:VanZ family protein